MQNFPTDPTAGESEYAVPAVSPEDRILVFRVQNRFDARAHAMLIPFDAETGSYGQPRMLPSYGPYGDISVMNYGGFYGESVSLARTILRACLPVELAELWAENYARFFLAFITASAWHIPVGAIQRTVNTWDRNHPEAKYRGAPVIAASESEVKE